MSNLIFSEESLINGNIFKFEERLQSQANRYVEGGAILTTYYNQDQTSSTVDRGIQDIDQLFGEKSPLRFHKIKNFPLYGFGQVNPDNSDEMQVEDINAEGDVIVLPSTIVPQPYDVFTVNHMKMTALFQITTVNYDSMKPNGYYKLHYRLLSTETDSLQRLEKQVVSLQHTDLNAIGTSLNPVIKEDDFVYRSRIKKMVNQMIDSYRALYYNERHNCFLYHDQETRMNWFDMCGNEFMGKHSIMNHENGSQVIMLNDKLRDQQASFFYQNSVYKWLEMGAPLRLLQKFYFILNFAEGYPYSTFARWNEGDVQVMQPISMQQSKINYQRYSIFDDNQFNAFSNSDIEPTYDYDKLIWKYIHKGNQMDIHDISLYTADALINSVRSIDTYLYTPMIIYIIREVLGMN